MTETSSDFSFSSTLASQTSSETASQSSSLGSVQTTIEASSQTSAGPLSTNTVLSQGPDGSSSVTSDSTIILSSSFFSPSISVTFSSTTPDGSLTILSSSRVTTGIISSATSFDPPTNVSRPNNLVSNSLEITAEGSTATPSSDIQTTSGVSNTSPTITTQSNNIVTPANKVQDSTTSTSPSITPSTELPTSPGLSTVAASTSLTSSATATATGTNNNSGLASPKSSSLSAGSLAGILISVVGSVILVFLILFVLCRRKRERARVRAIAHESFGNFGLLEQAGGARSQIRGHASTPSGVAFLSEKNEDIGGVKGFIAKVGRLGSKPRIDQDSEAQQVPQWQDFNVTNEKPLERSTSADQFLPNNVIPQLSPLAISGNDPFADNYGKMSTRDDLPGDSSQTEPQPIVTNDPFWDPEDLLPPALRLSALKKKAAENRSDKSTPTTNDGTNSSTDSVPSSNPKNPFADPVSESEPAGHLLDEPDFHNSEKTFSLNPKDVPVLMPDIFEMTHNSSNSIIQADAIAREGYASWVSQRHWSTNTASEGVLPERITLREGPDLQLGILQTPSPTQSETASQHTYSSGRRESRYQV